MAKNIFSGPKTVRQKIRRGLAKLADMSPTIFILLLSGFGFLFMNAFVIQFEFFSNLLLPEEQAQKGFFNNLLPIASLFSGELWSAEARGRLGAMILPGALFGLTVFALYRMRYRIFELDIDKKSEAEATPRRVLIMGLSVFKNFDASPADDFEKLRLEEACDRDSRFQWQQNLRVLHHHLNGDLPASGWWRRWLGKARSDRHVIILPSHEGCEKIAGNRQNGNQNGNQKYVERFVEMAERIIKKSSLPAERVPQFHIWPDPVNYNDLEGLKGAFRRIIIEARTNPEIMAREDEISIDTTAGTKLQSIAAAASTFASPIEFSYIEQGSNKFTAFDVTAGFREM